MSDEDVSDVKAEADAARLELYTAIKQAAEEVRRSGVVHADTITHETTNALLTLAQAWAVLQSPEGD